jgi:hypothetical protein
LEKSLPGKSQAKNLFLINGDKSVSPKNSKNLFGRFERFQEVVTKKIWKCADPQIVPISRLRRRARSSRRDGVNYNRDPWRGEENIRLLQRNAMI